MSLISLMFGMLWCMSVLKLLCSMTPLISLIVARFQLRWIFGVSKFRTPCLRLMIKIEGKMLGRRLVFYFDSFEAACCWLKSNWPVWTVAKRGLTFVERV